MAKKQSAPRIVDKVQEVTISEVSNGYMLKIISVGGGKFEIAVTLSDAVARAHELLSGTK